MTKAVIDEIRSKALSYIESEKEPYFRNQVKELLDKEDWDALYDAFYTALAFGTAGMRGVIGGGTNRINTFMVSKVTQGLAEYCNAHVDNPTVVIAYDSRHWSKEFATCASLVLSANGVRTYLYDTLHPVPMLSFAVRNLKTTAGIVITASHNPSKYNGYKVYWSDGGQVTPPHDIEIAKLANAAAAARETVPQSVDEAYYDMVLSSLRRPELVKGSPITVAYTPLHGSGNVPVREMLSRVGIRTCVVKEQEEPDGSFPTVKLPNPESAEAMTRVIGLAKEVKADIVLGTDPDADRMGLAIPTNADKTDYLLLTGNQIATLLADYLLTTCREMGGRDRRPLVVKSLVTTDLVRKIAKENGAHCKDVLTGFKYIAREMNAIDQGENTDDFFLFGCEESYGFLTVNDVHDKDAVSSAMAAVEMMCYYASKGITLQQRLDSIYAHYGYYTELVFSRDYEGAEGKTRMASIMKDLRSLEAGQTFVGRRIASVEDLLGEGTGFPKADVVIIRFESGEKLVVRPSGTEPKIKYYIFLVEGKGGRSALEENRGAILDEFKAAL